MQVARFVADIAHQHGFAARRGGSGDAFSERDRKAADDLFAVSHGVADSQVLPPVVIEQNGEEIVGEDPLDDFRDVGEKQVEIQGLRCCRRYFQQEIQEFGTFAETDRRLASGPRGLGYVLWRTRIRQR